MSRSYIRGAVQLLPHRLQFPTQCHFLIVCERLTIRGRGGVVIIIFPLRPSSSKLTRPLIEYCLLRPCGQLKSGLFEPLNLPALYAGLKR